MRICVILGFLRSRSHEDLPPAPAARPTAPNSCHDAEGQRSGCHEEEHSASARLLRKHGPPLGDLPATGRKGTYFSQGRCPRQEPTEGQEARSNANHTRLEPQRR
eukprot:13219577-Heterocapsa_arctica.AAC.1